MERAYAIAGLAIGFAVILISADLLLGGRISALLGKTPGMVADLTGGVSPPAAGDGGA